MRLDEYGNSHATFACVQPQGTPGAKPTSNLGQDGFRPWNIDRFGKMVVHTGLAAANDFLGHHVCRQGNDRNVWDRSVQTANAMPLPRFSQSSKLTRQVPRFQHDGRLTSISGTCDAYKPQECLPQPNANPAISATPICRFRNGLPIRDRRAATLTDDNVTAPTTSSKEKPTQNGILVEP